MSYKTFKNINNQIVNESIIHIDGDVAWTIPQDPANTDYQAYLEWLAEGNEPEVVEL